MFFYIFDRIELRRTRYLAPASATFARKCQPNKNQKYKKKTSIYCNFYRYIGTVLYWNSLIFYQDPEFVLKGNGYFSVINYAKIAM